jgi:hypothetical protein
MTERLLAHLRACSNEGGLVLGNEADLCRELGADRVVIATEIDRLAEAGLIEVLAPLPFLVARLRGTWPGKEPKSAVSAPSAYSAIQELSQSKQMNSSYRRLGAHGAIDASLLSEILETLGETDGKSFEKAVELYSPHVIHTALDRVRRAKGIRKNRTALFRHLLPRLARDEHRFDPIA